MVLANSLSSKKIDYAYLYMQVDFHIQKIHRNEDIKSHQC